jgi:nicotinamide-nucleotide amidase
VTPDLLITSLRKKGWRLAVAESCTGGLLASLLTSVSGSSDVFDRGYVTYSNAAKTDMLHVPKQLIETYGAVSREVAIAMAQGALENSSADIAIAITGIAGPAGGTPSKPVGLVHFACATWSGITHLEKNFPDMDRQGVRQAAAHQALELVMLAL